MLALSFALFLSRFLYFISDRGGSPNLWRVAIERETGRPLGSPHPITTPAVIANSIDVSSDGSMLAYGAFAASTQVRSVAFDPVNVVIQGTPSDIVTGTRAWLHPDLSPDGRLLTLRSWRAQEDVWVVGVDGSGLRNVTNDPARDRGPRFAPDGSILFYSNRSSGYQLWTVKPDGSGLRQLTNWQGGSLNYPLPSRDGQRVGGTNPSTREQYIFDAHDYSKPPERLPTPPAKTGVYLRDWSPDRSRIAASEAGDGVWIYHLGERRWDRIGEGIFPRWLPDGRRLLASRNFRIALYDAQSKRIRDVYSEPEKLIGSLAVARDGKRVYFTSAVTQADIWLVRFGWHDR